jgi:RHS repeat-associated protein
MNCIRKVLILLALGSVTGEASAYSYCANDGGYQVATQCFASYAQAKQYLMSNGKGPHERQDVDSSLFVSTGMSIDNGTTGIRKRYNFQYRDMTPTLAVGTWAESPGDPGQNTCAVTPYPFIAAAGCATEVLALQTGEAWWDSNGPDVTFHEFSRSQINAPVGIFNGGYADGRAVVVQALNQVVYQEEGLWAPPARITITNTEYWVCPDTHYPYLSPTLGQVCRSDITGFITVENEPIKLAETCSVGNPCHPQTGIKTQNETDFVWEGLAFTRLYQSGDEAPASALFGNAWTHSLDFSLSYRADVGNELVGRVGSEIEIYQQQGQTNYFHSRNTPGSRIEITSTGAVLVQPGGLEISFSRNSGSYAFSPVSVYDKATNKTFAVRLCTSSDSCSAGRIKSVLSNSGRSLDFRYADITGTDGNIVANRLVTVSTAGRALVDYDYDDLGRLQVVAYPNGADISTKWYGYNEAAKVCVTASGTSVTPCYVDSGSVLLTSIRDENGVAFASFGYDNFGRVVSSEHAGALDKVALKYNSDLSTVVTDQNNASTTYDSIAGRFYKLSSTVVGGQTRSFTYDARGFPDVSTDAAGVVTDADYDVDGRLVQLIRAKGTPQQQSVTTQWHPTLNLPVQIDRIGQRITRTYNGRGQPLTITTMDLTVTPNISRTSTFTYCEQSGIDAGSCPLLGLPLSADGPRADVSDISSYVYYQTDDATCATDPANCPHRKGDLWKRSNAVGQVTEHLRYDSVGRVLAQKDANGIVTDLEYSSRGWLTARKVRGWDDASEADDAITRLDYDNVGQVLKVTQPDGVYTTFTYDDAHRLTDITDALGNKIHFTLDNAGNRLKEETRDGSGALKRALSRVYNTLGQLQTLKDANLAAASFTYDATGDTNTVTDPLGRVTDNNVDPLGRLSQVIDNVNRRGVDQATTKFQYDERDNMTAVVDPKGLTTAYDYNGFDELVRLSSPDTASTVYAYDSAGNPFSQADARGILTTYDHDVLNRLTGISLPTLAQSVRFDFDVPPTDCQAGEMYGAGRLSQMQDESGSTRYCYDLRGNLVRKVQGVAGGSTLTVGSTYNGAGRLSAMTYPSGAVVVFLRNANGQIQRIDASPSFGSPQITLVSSASYLPFGPLTTLTFGNGRSLTKTFDQNYGIDLVSDSDATGLREDFTLNAVGNVTTLTERVTATSSVTRALGYDGLDRLITHKQGTKTIVEAFKYDATGNRTAKTVGSATTAYSYPNTNHRLTSVGSAPRTYDAAGHTESIGTGAAARGFEFDDRGRIRNFKLGTTVKATYRYNGKGERVLRLDSANAANSQQFLYDEVGHLLGEYTTTGDRVKEYVWLDDTLVAILGDHDGSLHQYVETDHLGSPRAVVDPVKNTIVWRWDINNSAFGEHLPSGDPDANGLVYALNLRFPGQYYDADSGLSYNYLRDFDPTTGRYVESDPIGLSGGTATYAYVNGNPYTAVDRLGLAGSPGIADQFNPYGVRGDGETNYTAYFNKRFPKTISGAAKLFEQRIKAKVCTRAEIGFSASAPAMSGGADDIDIQPDMGRFGDQPQGYYERNVKLGAFELKTTEIQVAWDKLPMQCSSCFSFSTTMYAKENTGDNGIPGSGFRERTVIMGRWPIVGRACCGR